MGDSVEIFFPTRHREGVSEDEFLKEQKSNWKRGVLFDTISQIWRIPHNEAKVTSLKLQLHKSLLLMNNDHWKEFSTQTLNSSDLDIFFLYHL